MSVRPSKPTELSRRTLLGGAAAAGAAATLGRVVPAAAAGLPKAEELTAKAPKGFVPMAAPGKVVKVAAKGDFKSIMQPNLLWPKAEIAKRLVEKALMEFTGAPNIAEALGKFIHKDDIVAIKPNGIAGQKGMTQATNFETVLPVVEGLIKLGVKPENIMVYEQYPTYLMGCRINVRKWKLPDGVQTGTHNNKNHPMQDVRIYQGIPTRYSKMLLDATAVIDMSMMKDHSICGYTGCLKNITHGNVNNPHDHHAHQASPQIAMLYNHPIVTSRVRLHITDAFKITYDRGPLDKDPNTRIPHGAVYVSTDPVAHDVIGWQVIDEERKKRHLKSLKEARREPRYIQTASELGLGVADPKLIRLRSYEI